MNAGPVIHPPLMVMNAAALQHFDRGDIHGEGTQPAVRAVTDALDHERIGVNAEGERDPEMHQAKKGTSGIFGMKAHIAVDADSGLVHTVTTTAANEADVEQIADLLHDKEQHVWADSGYRGAQSRVDREELQWHIAARPSDIAKMPEGRAKKRLQKKEHRKASIRAKVEHPFRVIKRQVGLAKVRFRGLAKNTAHVITLFALSNLWMARKKLMAMAGVVRPQTA